MAMRQRDIPMNLEIYLLAVVAVAAVGGCSSNPSGHLIVPDVHSEVIQAVDAKATADSAEVGTDSAACGPLDNLLRINHIQMLGTHNSYHVEKPGALFKAWRYSHDPLPIQLNDQGVRSFEFDLHHKTKDLPISVEHVQDHDNGTLCPTLGDCLQQLKTWSDANPCHHPLLVTLECKDDIETSHVADNLKQFETEVLAVWPKERLVRPDDLRGQAATLAEGLTQTQWPTLQHSRGKLMLILYDKEALFSKYLALHAGLKDAVAFVFGAVGDANTGAVLLDEPTDAKIAGVVKKGYIVRTFPEPTSAQAKAAVESGAHIVSTDYPVERKRLPGFSLQIPDGLPSRCNPVTAPVQCTAEAINAGVGTVK